MYPFAVGPPPEFAGGGGPWQGMEGGVGGNWSDDVTPEQKLAAVPPPQRSALMALLGGIGNVMGAPRRMLWDAMGIEGSGADFMARNIGGLTGDDPNNLANQGLGMLMEGVLDPVTLGLGAGGGLARLMSRGANAGGAARLGGLIANDARAIDMTNDARQMASSLTGQADDVARGLPGVAPRGTLMPPAGGQSSLAAELNLPAMPSQGARATFNPAAMEEMQAASIAGYNPAMVDSLPGLEQMAMTGGRLGEPIAGMARQYKVVDEAVADPLTKFGWMIDGGPKQPGQLLYGQAGAGTLPPWAQLRGGGIRPTPGMDVPPVPQSYMDFMSQPAMAPMMNQADPAQMRQMALQRIARLAQGG